MNLVLIGMMGVGKTTVGKMLADRLKRPFFDSDDLIQTRYGDISMIFEIMGQQKFRLWEQEAIEELSRQRDAVLSTGGGAILQESNVTALKRNGKLIYLRATRETLCERLETSGNRPLLSGDVREKIRTILQERASRYEEASDLAIDTDGLSPEEVVREIQAKLQEFEGGCMMIAARRT